MPVPTLRRAPILPSLLLMGLFPTTAALHGASVAPDQNHPGAVIYRNTCLECHGAKGEGVAGKYDDPLHGERSLESLTKRIERTMPEGKEGTCVGDDAKNVAEYIYHAFYSAEAQARNAPAPLRDLTHLTNSQYRTSVADIMARFRQPLERLPNERGLKGRYNGFEIEPPPPPLHGPPRPGKKKLEPVVDEDRERPKFRMERLDPQVAFSFGADSPAPGKAVSDEFSIRWEGSLIVEETGSYEFILKTENGVRLTINDFEKSLIDAWVTPGPDVREEKKSIHLIGGRVYPISVEFFKFKDKTASVALQWKPPHGVQENIPSRFLIPQRGSEVFVSSTNFPADDRSDGYERGTGMSKDWEQATTDAAIELAEYVEKRLDRLAGTKAGAPDRADKLKDFAKRFAEATYRRPLTPEEQQVFIDGQFTKAPTPEMGVKRVVLLALKSPVFLYPGLADQQDKPDYKIATRLALDLWDSIPDKRLLEAAAQGKLRKKEEIRSQAVRMVTDPRTKAKLHGFFHHWLELERAEMIAKDSKTFPDFSAAVVADLRSSLWMFIDQVIWSERSDYRELLQADYLMLNERLAKFYSGGKEKPAGSEFQRVSFENKQRTGVLTHPYLLSSFAYTNQSSPIHRGVFITRNIVGMDIKPPPDDVKFDDAHFNPKLTMREKVTELTKSGACMGCHGTINPLGFSLENYDAIGRFRLQDNNKPVDATSELETHDGKTLKLTGPRDIAQYAVANPAGHLAFIRHLFNHTVKQPHLAYGPETLEGLRQSFEKNQFSVQKLLQDIAVLSASQDLPEIQGTVTQK
ncbi:cytochrome c553 [Roseimicrobium gellanilyticum]|uniref:Cytochrome c553 n=1 Tax=Roseimicrobium gellanilyticum TaxID=748857 RepID=A0A366HUX2_9BACT|nr:DUF1592 domain-containing protein [Roseimicrobium gellanilyticum]RBP47897.1 cytochrome c553 [Roseimicrobium gellanilyticum]